MNRIRKSITVRFFSIEASESFFDDFIINFLANRDNSNSSRIFNLKTKKHLIKLGEEHILKENKAYSVSVVRERNTWQTKATSDGQITGISLNQGIIGDPYYFFVVPDKKILLALTSGPIQTLRSVGKSMLEQLQSSRSEKIRLSLIPKEQDFVSLEKLSEKGSLNFKINPSSFSDISSDAPQLIRDLSSNPYIENSAQKLTLNLDFEDAADQLLSRDHIMEIIDYLSDHEGCEMLRVKWHDEEGNANQLDFVNAFFNYRTEITTRHTFIEESVSVEILKEAFATYLDN
ncbi:MAG: hypothetical protein CMH25_04915 [Micavibrio sp.]|nr:hypothetical protein [Micavibrio sp.]|tara:strand:- start:552 stop:1418 length:867 start_codon:yes stop_codon:yes gene_type:complete